jgi:hypothetical protein
MLSTKAERDTRALGARALGRNAEQFPNPVDIQGREGVVGKNAARALGSDQLPNTMA